jgi:lysyl-tRNA synthetase class II
MMCHGFTFLICYLLCTTASAAEVYKWEDDQGQVHYGRKPPDDGATAIEIKPHHESDQATLKRIEKNEKLLRVYEEERQISKQEAMEARKEEEERRNQCTRAKKALDNLDYGGRLYRLNENGEKVFLSEEDRNKERQAIRKQMKKVCT